MKKIFLAIGVILLSMTSYSQELKNFETIGNVNGPTLGYSKKSGVKILTVNGLKFKDLNKNGKLDKYEDWRLPVDERAKDLAGKMSESKSQV